MTVPPENPGIPEGDVCPFWLFIGSLWLTFVAIMGLAFMLGVNQP